jgi:hypothetical protein
MMWLREWWRWPPNYNSPISLMKFSKGSQNSHNAVFSRQFQTSQDRFETLTSSCKSIQENYLYG